MAEGGDEGPCAGGVVDVGVRGYGGEEGGITCGPSSHQCSAHHGLEGKGRTYHALQHNLVCSL